jgi:glycosyltransferase involved in cell wall biosynthesis
MVTQLSDSQSKSQTLSILCVIDSLGSGGSQRQLSELAIGFKERGHRVTMMVYHEVPFFEARLKASGVGILSVFHLNYFKRFLKMRRLIRTGQYDVVISYLESPSLICELAGLPWRKWRLIVGERSANPAIPRRLKLRLYRWAHVLSDVVVSNSEANRVLVLSANCLLDQSKVKVIYNAIDLSKWSPSIAGEEVRRENIRLTIVASHQYLKNLEGLIKSLVLLTKDELNRLAIDWYGDRVVPPYFDGSLKAGLRLIESHGLQGVIKFYPATKNIREIIRSSDVVGLFSWYEGFPNAVCEAMACGKPVICSITSDMPTILSYDQRVLCDPMDPHSIAASIRYILTLSQHELVTLGELNRRIAVELFDREKILTEYITLMSRADND